MSRLTAFLVVGGGVLFVQLLVTKGDILVMRLLRKRSERQFYKAVDELLKEEAGKEGTE